MLNDIRSRVIGKVYEQCRKLLGPDDHQYPVNENYLKQWDAEIRTPDGQPIDYVQTDPAQLPADYPLNRRDFIILDKLDSFGLDARRIQLVQIGSMDWQNLQAEGLIPCIFIEESSPGSVLQAVTGVNYIGETFPMNIRLVTTQAPDSSLEVTNSNPIRNASFRAALDYLLDPFFFLGLHERKGIRKGFKAPSHVVDAGITLTTNLEGEISPFEVVDYRFEVIIDRIKQVGRGIEGDNEITFDPVDNN